MCGRFFGVDLMSSPIVPAVHHGDGLSGLWASNVATGRAVDYVECHSRVTRNSAFQNSRGIEAGALMH